VPGAIDVALIATARISQDADRDYGPIVMASDSEAIQFRGSDWIASSLSLLAMTAFAAFLPGRH